MLAIDLFLQTWGPTAKASNGEILAGLAGVGGMILWIGFVILFSYWRRSN